MRRIRFFTRSLTILAVALLVGILGVSVKPVEAQPPYPQGRYYMVPSDNTYPGTTTPGTRFNVTFYAYNLTTEPEGSFPGGCFAYQFKVYCNNTVLDITGAWRAQWLTNWIFYGKSTVGVTPEINVDSKGNYALVADTLLSGTPMPTENVTTDVVLGIVEFNITRVPSGGETVFSLLNMTNIGTLWLGPTQLRLHRPYRENGSYFIPELHPTVLVLALLVATTAGLASAKIVKLKKNKEIR